MPADRGVADDLVDLIREDFSLSRSDLGRPLIARRSQPHIWFPLDQHLFGSQVSATFHSRFNRVPSRSAVADALFVVAGLAASAPAEPVSRRFANADGSLWLDRGGTDGRVVCISPGRWEETDQCPARFLRTQFMRELPSPSRGGDINPYLRLLRVPSRDRVLIAVYAAASFDPSVTKPLLVLWGEAGSGKSTTLDLVADLIDPLTIRRLDFQVKTTDWTAALETGAVVAIDNWDGGSRQRISDMCQAVTGGTHVSRMLYTDSTPYAVDMQRILMLTTTGVKGLPDDLLDRVMRLDLRKVREGQLDEWLVKERADELRPAALGWLCDFAAEVLEELPDTATPSLRMASFGRWLAAADSLLDGSVLERYKLSTRRAKASALEGDELLSDLPGFVRRQGGVWEGTCSDLAAALRGEGTSLIGMSPEGLGKRLRAGAASLEAAGVSVDIGHRSSDRQTRLVCLWQSA